MCFYGNWKWSKYKLGTKIFQRIKYRWEFLWFGRSPSAVIRNVALDENNEFKPFSEEALYDGFIGLLSSILLGAPGTVKSTADISSLGKTINTNEIQQELLDLGIKQGVETEAFRQAERINKKLMEDKKITPYEWGRLLMN